MMIDENPRQSEDEKERRPYAEDEVNKIMADIFTDRGSSEDGLEKETKKTIETSTGYYCDHEDKWHPVLPKSIRDSRCMPAR
mgnify:CR=1 FL=1